MYQIIQGEVCAVFRQILFVLEDVSLSLLTGKSVSAGNMGINVGASTFTSCAGTVGELGRGIYIYTPVTSEVSSLGLGILAGSYTSANSWRVPFQVVASIRMSTNNQLEVIAQLKTSAISAGAIDTSAFAASKFDSTHYAQQASVVAASILATPSQKLVTNATGYVGVYLLGSSVVSAGAIDSSAITQSKLDSTTYAQMGSVAAGYILVTPTQKLTTNNSGYVGVYILNTSIISATTFSTSALTSAVIDGTVYGAVADNIIRRNIEGGSYTGRPVGDLLAVNRNRVDITGTGSSRTVNVYAIDDTSVKWSASVGLSARDAFQTFDPA